MKWQWMVVAAALAAGAALAGAGGHVRVASVAWLLGMAQAAAGQWINRRAVAARGRDRVLWPLAAHGAKALALALVLALTRNRMGDQHTAFVVSALACYFVLLFAEVADLHQRAGRPVGL